MYFLLKNGIIPASYVCWNQRVINISSMSSLPIFRGNQFFFVQKKQHTCPKTSVFFNATGNMSRFHPHKPRQFLIPWTGSLKECQVGAAVLLIRWSRDPGPCVTKKKKAANLWLWNGGALRKPDTFFLVFLFPRFRWWGWEARRLERLPSLFTAWTRLVNFWQKNASEFWIFAILFRREVGVDGKWLSGCLS